MVSELVAAAKVGFVDVKVELVGAVVAEFVGGKTASGCTSSC